MPAARLADEGFPVDRSYARRLAALAADLSQYPGTRAVFLGPDGSPYREGEVLRQPDLARTYRAVAAEGVGWFYRGPLARRVRITLLSIPFFKSTVSMISVALLSIGGRG